MPEGGSMLEALSDQLSKYKRHAEVLRQIHSDRALTFGRLDSGYNTALLVTSAITTFLGFSGLDRLRKLTNCGWSSDAFEFMFNCSVFLILLLTMLNLIFRFQEHRSQHDRAVSVLTNIIQELDDQRALSIEVSAAAAVLERFRVRYSSVTNTLPPTTDLQFLRGKEHYFQKKVRSKEIEAKYAPK